MHKAKSAYFKELNPKNPKEFWRAVKFLNKKQSSIPTLSKDSCVASTGPEKANLLNAYISECFNRSVPPLSKLMTSCLRYQIPITFHLNFCAMKKAYVSY